MLKFSNENAKIKKLAEVPSIAQFLGNGRKIYSFDLLSGHSCPYAHDCQSRAVEVDGKRKIKDGMFTIFRCFSASQEVLYTNLYNLRKHNYNVLKGLCKDDEFLSHRFNMYKRILADLPEDAGVVRLHVAGDFFNQKYFEAWMDVARTKSDVLFYAYTKSLPYWLANRKECDTIKNLVLTASVGGRRDDLIETEGFRFAKVVMSEEEADDFALPIDHDDSHAADPNQRFNNFSILIHGVQPAKSEAGKAVVALKGAGSYSR